MSSEAYNKDLAVLQHIHQNHSIKGAVPLDLFSLQPSTSPQTGKPAVMTLMLVVHTFGMQPCPGGQKVPLEYVQYFALFG